MQQNPLFPSSSNDGSQLPDYLRTSMTTPHAPNQGSGALPAMQPISQLADTGTTAAPAGRNEAADLIRRKVAAIYAGEPSAKAEMQEAAAAQAPLSKHQQFMQGLQASGRSMAEIQAAWHAYYAELSDAEKQDVWHEYYGANQQPSAYLQDIRGAQTHDSATAQSIGQAQIRDTTAQTAAADTVIAQNSHGRSQEPVVGSDNEHLTYQSPKPGRTSKKAAGKPLPSVTELKQQILQKVSSAKDNRHTSIFKSLGFGLVCGTVAILFIMFSFFNEVIISPFIQPSRQAIETPVITDPSSSIAAGNKVEVIIPKINVEIPVDYSQTTTSEAAIETALESGVVHYPTTVQPGQQGNAAFFGHSSNNIFNPGKYKFAFVLLHKLTEGDTFYLTYNGKTYAYEVISHQIVKPSDVGVLGPVPGQTATATLITCDPPGTSLNRLVVVGKQISPDPTSNGAPSQTPAPTITADATPSLPGNGPTLFSRLWHSVF